MADLDKNKKASQESKNKTEQGRAKKARRLVMSQTLASNNNVDAFILPSYHLSVTANPTQGSHSSIAHTSYTRSTPVPAYTATETKGHQSVSPVPPTHVASDTEFQPRYHTENTGGHHYHHADTYIGQQITPVVGVLGHNLGQFTPVVAPTNVSHAGIVSHTGAQQGFSYLMPPIIGTPSSGTVIEDSTLVTNGTVDAHSPQQGSPLTFTPDNLHGQYGEFSLDKDTGEWSYKLDNSHHQNLALGESHTEILHVTVTNEAGVAALQDITVIVQGTNDIPVIVNTPQHGATKEDGVLTAQGQLAATDVDHGEVITYTADNLQGHYGAFTLEPRSGKWHYTLDNPHDQNLAEGETHTESMLVTLTDDKGAQVTETVSVTVVGTNDAPVVTITPDAKGDHSKGTVTATDVDTGDTHTFQILDGQQGSQSVQGQFGDLVLDEKTGAYTYSAHAGVQGMGYDAQTQQYRGQESFHVQVSDNHGGVDDKYITFEVQGTVAAPTTSGQPGPITTTVVAPTNPTTQASLPQVTDTPPTLTPLAPVPTNAVTLDLTDGSDTGSSHSDDLTSSQTPIMSGTTDIPFSVVTISENG
ncbi:MULTISPECIES: VCBS domain-containing protein, partial [unclassified Vibrio]|uniref:VCBS domain-containing protein n=1 Tax=unclassified Vibrio TaxID=2614977 RepID=UPI000A8E55D4